MGPPTLLLINPARKGGLRGVQGAVSMEPLGLACVAAQTPSHWRTLISDETVGDDWRSCEPDLVGLTSLTPTATRAYEIAAHWRSRGVPVVLGGMHASMCPEEAGGHVDSVYCGEAESGWRDVIGDFEHGELKARYDVPAAKLESLPLPRRDLYRHKYWVSLVSASRGCRNRCEFCSIWRFSGGTYRQRPVSDVLAELSDVPKGHITLFVDDNIYTEPGFALELFRTMAAKGLRRPHAVQAALDIADDPEVLAALRASGCLAVLVGLESLNESTLRGMRKGVNLRVGADAYGERIRRIHEHGLMAAGTFIFGADGDDPSVFARTAEFVLEAGLDIAHFGLLVPTPGTDVYNRLQSEGRLLFTSFPADYELYDLNRGLFQPKGMTVREAEDGLASACQRIGSWSVVPGRTWRTFRSTRSLRAALLALVWTRTGLYRRVVN